MPEILAGLGISALVLAPARTVGDDRGKLVSVLTSTWLLAFDVHVSNAPVPNSGSHF